VDESGDAAELVNFSFWIFSSSMDGTST